MMEMIDLQVELDPSLLAEMREIFEAQGLTVEDAILGFMRNVVDDPEWTKSFFENAGALADAHD